MKNSIGIIIAVLVIGVAAYFLLKSKGQDKVEIPGGEGISKLSGLEVEHF